MSSIAERHAGIGGPPTSRNSLALALMALLALIAGCSGGNNQSPVTIRAGDIGPEADAGVDGGSIADLGVGMCAEYRRVDCRDRIEGTGAEQWSARPRGESTSIETVDSAVYGQRAVRIDVDDSNFAEMVWEPESPVDASAGAGAPVLHVAVRGDNPNGSGWRGETPFVTVVDTEGRKMTLVPAEGNAELLSADGRTWWWLDVPLEERRGWRASFEGGDSVDLSSIARIEFRLNSFGSGFALTLDGLAFTARGERCRYECSKGCNGRGTCDPAMLRCRCELGAVGPTCGNCGEGFEPGPDGSCRLSEDGEYDEWPNPVSDTNGDAWLRKHHEQVEVLRPRVLVLNFANDSSMSGVERLSRRIVKGFELASTPVGTEQREPQLQYQLAKVVDMRNGHAGHPDAPEDWSYENSTLWPREKTDSGDVEFDYAELFTEEFASHYGYDSEDGSDATEAVARREGPTLWLVGAHTEADATPNEVLEYKQRYTAGDNPIPGSFSPCAGNGCFSSEVSACDRTVRIGFINYKRGPGCYLHNMAHLLEWTNSHRVVPGFSRWFDRFAGMDLEERYGLPVESLYGVQCSDKPCIRHPDPGTTVIRHRGETYRIAGWNQYCGNCHFPPNGAEHYDYENGTPVRSTCNTFGRSGKVCGGTAGEPITQSAWRALRSKVPDCGGGFLVWWYRRMPAHGTSHTYPSGEPMKSVWPYLFY
ncbi:MAG: hypothetical protein ABEL76_02785 [Bradymonadaceae bacterium]